MTRLSPAYRTPPCRGGALVAGLFWIVALALLFLPFARDPDAMSAEGDDPARAESDIPFEEDVAVFDQEFSLALGELLATAGEEYYAPDSPALLASGLVNVTRLPGGRLGYQTHCIGCHGSIGDGAGPAARHLAPRPRNFRKGLFKFKSTATGERPRRRDLLQTVTRGLAGSSMPAFGLLAEELRLDIVEYVRWLSIKGEFQQTMLDIAWDEEELPDAAEVADIVNARWQPARLRPVFPGVLEPTSDAASVERGRELFNDMTRAACVSCHGPEGRGDGPNADAYEDDWGYPLKPRDLTAGVFRAGSEGADLYRTIAVGITGTPMSSFEGALTPEQTWDLVHFVQSLPGTGGAR